MPSLKSYYALSLGVGLVFISLPKDSWREWDPFIDIQVGIKTKVGQ